ncbi:MAG: hypothetical protein ACLFQO_08670 [Cyclobacteriaceae bacterium]
MKDIDKLFSDKLKHHQQSPPNFAWDKLETKLDAAHGRKRRVLVWRIAAAVSLLLLGGVSLWYSGMLVNESQPLAIEMATTITDQALPEAALPLLPDHLRVAVQQAQKPAVSAQRKSKEEVSENLTAELQDREKATSQQDQPETLLAEAEALPDEKLKEAPDLLEKIVPENDLSELSAPLAQLEEPRRVKSGITLIYKPGGAESIEKNASPLAFLDELKNSGISIAEIRNAKSELLAKVFSKKEELLND